MQDLAFTQDGGSVAGERAEAGEALRIRGVTAAQSGPALRTSKRNLELRTDTTETWASGAICAINSNP